MRRIDLSLALFLAALGVLAISAASLPAWAQYFASITLAFGLVVLGLVLLMKTGLVSFGQSLYYCLGAYAAGILNAKFGVTDMLIAVLAGALVAGTVAFLLGFLMASYRHIFFATLSLAFSMVLYGLIVKSAALGSTDGFNLLSPTLLGIKPEANQGAAIKLILCTVFAGMAAFAVARYLQTPLGRLAPAIRDNELRVEYMGASVRHAVHVNYTIAGVLGGVGGALAALTVGHIDPDSMGYWTVSGEFVFIAVLSGTANVAAPFLAALLFETVRTLAHDYSPNTWQMTLGGVMLLLILFLPGGVASLLARKRATQ
jgi:ABC-type branched-subunit amino acid transport system permease subunit